MSDDNVRADAMRQLIDAAEFVISESRHAPDAKNVSRFRRSLDKLQQAIDAAKQTVRRLTDESTET